MKKWGFTGGGSSPSTAPYVYKIGSDANAQFGVEGQGNPDPISDFENHFIVKYVSTAFVTSYYDPSYGNGPYISQAAWENDSLDGFWAYGYNWGEADNFAKKNDPTVVESRFIEL